MKICYFLYLYFIIIFNNILTLTTKIKYNITYINIKKFVNNPK